MESHRITPPSNRTKNTYSLHIFSKVTRHHFEEKNHYLRTSSAMGQLLSIAHKICTRIDLILYLKNRIGASIQNLDTDRLN